MKIVFLAGVGTDVGKTYVGRLWLSALVEKGVHVKARKPIETGCHPDTLHPCDANALNQACAPYCEDLNVVCPYRFVPACSPERAAFLAGKKILVSHLQQAVLQQTQAADVVLVEGAGGLFSPIAHQALNIDLARALHAQIYVVAVDKLGVLSEILSIHKACQTYGVSLAGVILNKSKKQNHGVLDNPAEARAYLSHTPILEIAYQKNGVPYSKHVQHTLCSWVKD